METSWIQIISLFLANAALVVWFRVESRNDWRHMDAKVDALREDTNHHIKAIHEEMKQFHARMCVIEEMRKVNR